MVIGESVTAVQRVSLSSFCLNTFLYVFIECFLRVFFYGAAMQTFLHQRSMKSLSFTLAWRWSDYQLECEKAHEWQMTSGRAGLCLLSTFEAGWSMVSSLACRCKSNESKKKKKETYRFHFCGVLSHSFINWCLEALSSRQILNESSDRAIFKYVTGNSVNLKWQHLKLFFYGMKPIWR